MSTLFQSPGYASEAGEVGTLLFEVNPYATIVDDELFPPPTLPIQDEDYDADWSLDPFTPFVFHQPPAFERDDVSLSAPVPLHVDEFYDPSRQVPPPVLQSFYRDPFTAAPWPDGREAYTEFPHWYVDPKAGISFPRNLGEWTQFIANTAVVGLISTPTLCLPMQDAAVGAAIVDTILGVSFAATGADAGSILYRQAVTGWTALAVQYVEDDNHAFLSTDSSIPDLSTTSCAVLIYMRLPSDASGSNFETCFTMGGTGVSADAVRIKYKFIGGKDIINVFVNGVNVASNTSIDEGGDGVGFPILLQWNVTAGQATLYTRRQQLYIPYSAIASGHRMAFGDATGDSLTMDVQQFGAAVWSGSSAEFPASTAYTLLPTLGWTIALKTDFDAYDFHLQSLLPPPRPQVIYQSPLFQDDFVPPSVAATVDEDLSLVTQFKSVWASQVDLDRDEIPAGGLHGQFDEDFGPPLPKPLFATVIRNLASLDVEELPAGDLFGQFDEDFGPPLGKPVSTILRNLASLDPEELPAGDFFGQADEDFGPPLPRPVVAIVVRNLASLDPDEQWVTAPPTLGTDEDFGPPLPKPVIASVVRNQASLDPEELPAGDFFGQADEDFGPPLPKPTVASVSLDRAARDPDEVSAGDLFGQADEDFGPPLPKPAPAVVTRDLSTRELEDPIVTPIIHMIDEDLGPPLPRPVASAVLLDRAVRDQDEISAGDLHGQYDEDLDQLRQLSRPVSAFNRGLVQRESDEAPAPYLDDNLDPQHLLQRQVQFVVSHDLVAYDHDDQVFSAFDQDDLGPPLPRPIPASITRSFATLDYDELVVSIPVMLIVDEDLGPQFASQIVAAFSWRTFEDAALAFSVVPPIPPPGIVTLVSGVAYTIDYLDAELVSLEAATGESDAIDEVDVMTADLESVAGEGDSMDEIDATIEGVQL